ncbi:hypothetical protein D3C77_468180 [compost metagenome]
MADQAGHFIDQHVGQQVILTRKQFLAVGTEAVQLLRPATGGAQITAHHQVVTLQCRQVLAHRSAGHGQLAGQLLDAHAGRLVQQGRQQILLSTPQTFEHQLTSLRTCSGTV